MVDLNAAAMTHKTNSLFASCSKCFWQNEIFRPAKSSNGAYVIPKPDHISLSTKSVYTYHKSRVFFWSEISQQPLTYGILAWCKVTPNPQHIFYVQDDKTGKIPGVPQVLRDIIIAILNYK